MATCVTKILQGEGSQTCTVSDKQGIASVKVDQVNGTSFVKAFGGCSVQGCVKTVIPAVG